MRVENGVLIRSASCPLQPNKSEAVFENLPAAPQAVEFSLKVSCNQAHVNRGLGCAVGDYPSGNRFVIHPGCVSKIKSESETSGVNSAIVLSGKEVCNSAFFARNPWLTRIDT